MAKDIVIYGAGNRGKNLYELLFDDSEYNIIAVVDGNPEMWGSKFSGQLKIAPPEIMRSYRALPICITIHNSRILQSVRERLEKVYSYDLTREIEYEELVWKIFEKKLSGSSVFSVTNNWQLIFDSYMGLGLGGIEAWTKDVTMGLLNRGWKDIHILSDQHEYPISEQLFRIVDKVERAEDNATEDGQTNFQNLITYFSNHLPCTIVTSRFNVELMAACTVKKNNPDKVKIISVIHMGTQDTYQKYFVFKDYVDLYIGVSQDIRRGMLDLGIPEEKVISMTCPFACEKDLVRSYTENKDLPICIGYAGRLDSITPAQKRVDLLLKLIQELIDRKISFKLEIAGDGPAKIPMEEFVQNKEWKNRVTFLGSIERTKIADFWKRQDVCINVADFEGRSISVIEAMGNGAIPVVTQTSGIREDVENGVNGYSVSLQDYKGIADRIGYLEENRDTLHIMGQKAHDKVYPKSVMSAHIDFWEGILKGVDESCRTFQL